jgi:taurine dioxygenase
MSSSLNLGRHFIVRPLTSSIGAEVKGVDLRMKLSDDLFNKIYEAFLGYQVLVFRVQEIHFVDEVTDAEKIVTSPSSPTIRQSIELPRLAVPPFFW